MCKGISIIYAVAICMNEIKILEHLMKLSYTWWCCRFEKVELWEVLYLRNISHNCDSGVMKLGIQRMRGFPLFL